MRLTLHRIGVHCGAAFALACLPTLLYGQDAETCLSDFQNNAAAFTSPEQWRRCGTLPAGAFARIKAVLEQQAANEALEVGLSDALIVFSEQEAFRADLALYAETAFPPGSVSDTSRLVITALVSECERAPSSDIRVWRALVRHRFYRQPNALTEFTELGDSMRSCLTKYRTNLSRRPPESFIPAFAFAISPEITMSASTAQLTKLTSTEVEALEIFDREFREPLLKALSAPDTIRSQTWVVDVTGRENSDQPLAVLQQALLHAYKMSVAGSFYPGNAQGANAEAKELAAAGLQTHLDRAAELWTSSATDWFPDLTTTLPSAAKVFAMERHLEDALLALRSGAFLTTSAADDYLRWITLAGGWNAPSPGEPIPNAHATIRPSWGRDWQNAATVAASLDVVEAVPLQSFIRLARKFQTAGENVGELDNLWSLSDTVFLDRQASEVFALSFALGILPQANATPILPKDNWLTDWRAHPRSAAVGGYLFPQNQNSRKAVTVTLHPDHVKALRVVLADYYIWYADLEYRGLGPQPVNSPLTPAQTRRAAALYSAAQQVLDSASATNWKVGLGLFSYALDREARESRHECELRLKQLAAGLDYVGQTIPWPNTYVWDTIDSLKTILGLLQQFQQTQVNASRVASLADDRETARLAELKAEALEDAQSQAVRAELLSEDALRIQQTQQDIRVDIAGLKEKEANAMVDAQQAAVEAANSGTISQGLREKLAQNELDVLNAQVDQLKATIDALSVKMPDIQQQVQQAQDDIPDFRARATKAYDDANQPSFWSAVAPVLKAVGSAVSMYFTGVNLVGIAESAVAAVGAAESGDWQASAAQAYSAVNMATKGEFGKKADEFLKNTTQNAESYLTTLMPDSLSSSISAVKVALRVDDNKAVQLAIEAVSKRAALTGLGFVNKEENLNRIAGTLGLSREKRAVLSGTIQRESSEAVARALEGFGEEFRTAASAKLPGLIGDRKWVEVDWKAVRESLAASQHIQLPPDLEGAAVGLIGVVHQQLAAVDTAPLKAELLGARDRIRRRTAELANTTIGRADAAIDTLAKEYESAMSGAAATLALNPPPLPRPVRDHLTTFHASVNNARAKVAFLLDTNAQSTLMSKLAQSSSRVTFDQNLESVVNELSGNLNAARTSMGEAANTLSSLSSELDELKHKSHVAEVNEAIAQFELKAKASQQEERDHLLSAAGEAVLIAKTQIQIEKLGREVLSKQVESQHSRVGQQQAILVSVKLDHDIARHKKEQADREYNAWSALFSSDRQDSWRHETELWYRNYCNLKLMQVWRLIEVFEPKPEVWDLQSFGNPPPGVVVPRLLPVPKYAIPKTEDLNTAISAYQAAKEFGKLERLSERPLLTTIHIPDLRKLHPPDAVNTFLAGFGDPQPLRGLQLSGEADLNRLLTGVSFAIHPNDYVPEATNRNPRPAVQSLLSLQDGYRALSWHVGDADRLRILGVLVEVDPGTLKEGGVNFYLTQEQDGWFVARKSDHTSIAVPLPVPPRLFKAQPGISIHDNILVTRDVSTLPVFGSYTLRIRKQDYSQVIDPKTFKATLHFVVLGVNPQ